MHIYVQNKHIYTKSENQIFAMVLMIPISFGTI